MISLPIFWVRSASICRHMSANFPIIVSGGNRHQTGSHARTRKTAADQKLNLPVVLPADLKSDQSICIFDGITTATTIPTTDAMRSDLTEKLVNPFIIILKDFKNVKPDSLSSPGSTLPSEPWRWHALSVPATDAATDTGSCISSFTPLQNVSWH